MATKKDSGPKDTSGFRVGGRLDHDGQALFEGLQFVLASSSSEVLVSALLALTDSLPPGHQDTLRRAMGLRKASLSRLRKSHGQLSHDDTEIGSGAGVGAGVPAVEGMSDRMARINGLAERAYAPIDAAIERLAD